MQLLTISETAKRLSCSTRMVRRLVATGRLRVVRLGETARSDRVHPDDLEAFVQVRRGEIAPCRSENAVLSGKLTSRTKDVELEKLLGMGPQKPRPSKSNPKSSKTSSTRDSASRQNVVSLRRLDGG